ncbi:RNA polymerase II subunit B1 CTD phosphatase RTR1 NDAI_0B03020 [Naumovozyma dairenensis CBS 421]|uniref:RNA polymerase II subunit B1 CTD phosphatase RPAP2 homolog n=1 Tax=Naumovozyma dairenensis (strain ATCC 10597 / BCRC 20456 / CBS 421 / NBRC 0211 / NRRL Y-12639) TaxID=1071378 RepID=G0W6C6_NAUDC|nr:hypothetical protein NDAI_0B03020 [Naumovozyma dairenensis CBS 421]CCD23337.1 hypothetical protein NDAI_0B03020 [Naumovozyma dairenensis CBS 421]
MTTIETIQKVALGPYQRHRQLSMNEAEMLSLEVISLLCDSYCADETTLKYTAKLITPDIYMNLIDERNLNKRCGYPLCNKSPERLRDPFSIDEVTKKFLWENNPYAYLSRFCSKFHFRCSQFYQLQLSNEALFSRTGIHLINNHIYDKDGEDIITSFNSPINERYNVVLFEEFLREKATEEDIKSLVAGLKKLGLQGETNETKTDDHHEDLQWEQDLSKWLSEIKIVEIEKPNLLGDFQKEEEED